MIQCQEFSTISHLFSYDCYGKMHLYILCRYTFRIHNYFMQFMNISDIFILMGLRNKGTQSFLRKYLLMDGDSQLHEFKFIGNSIHWQKIRLICERFLFRQLGTTLLFDHAKRDDWPLLASTKRPVRNLPLFFHY